jgi:hypothetical protein
MTITLTLPDDLYQRVVEVAERHDVSAERIATGALVEQMAQSARIEPVSAKSSESASLPRWTECRMSSLPWKTGDGVRPRPGGYRGLTGSGCTGGL